MARPLALRAWAIGSVVRVSSRGFRTAQSSANQIAAISGHASLREVERYTAAASQALLADQALIRQLRAEREQNLPNTETPVYPTTKKA
jgi:hypothetical protein